MKKITALAILLLMLAFAIPLKATQAKVWQEDIDAMNKSLEEWEDYDNLGGAFKGNLNKAAEEAGYDKEKKDVEPIIGTVIQSMLSFLGVIFVILTIYGGFLWMTAKGNEEQVIKAKNLFIAAVTGLVIVFAAYAITYFVLGSLTEGTGVLKGT